MQNQTDDHLPMNDEQFKGIFEHMREGFAYCRMIYESGEPRDFIYLEANPAFEELTGLTGVRGRFASEVIPGIRESNPELFETYGRVARTGKPEKFERYLENLGIWISLSVSRPRPEHFVIVVDNITEHKQAEREWLNQFAHSNDLIHAVAQIMTHLQKAITPDEIVQTLGRELKLIDLTCIMATYDRELSFFMINYTSLEPKVLKQMENAIGFPILKHTFPLGELVAILDQQDVREPTAIIHGGQEMQVLFPHEHEEVVLQVLEAIGVGREAEGLRLPLLFEDNLLGILWVWGKNITSADIPILSILTKQIGSSLERARLFQEVQSLALTDSLTGLHSRRSLFELGRIEFARAKRAKTSLSCLLLDLDHFRQVNDTYGHLTGDEVLQEFAERAKRSVREVDLVGRYGGEELVILLPQTDLATAVQIAERLRRSMEDSPIRASGLELSITVSIGAATNDENTPNVQTLLARADQAMYVGKYKGRNRVAISR